jgi:hypothetical protein
MPRLTVKLAGCNDSTCPAIYATEDPGLIAVQGTALTDPAVLSDAGEIPSHERLVLIPRSLLDQYADGR